ncbi:unnamed protein product [Arabis nemorensis]|uniref:NYN domain-containing protein n=1 Tax=Arabis nemorensis TaxID=586526 RepID=A0A565BB44_9BRAS|nr:unnamed protein product [Arabis nemorensis]
MIHNIVVGILLLSLDNPAPANVMGSHIKSSRRLGHGYFSLWKFGLASQKPISPPKKKKRPIVDISDSNNSTYLVGVNPNPMRYSAETMWSEFPPPPAGCDGREVFVLWDVDDPSILERVDPRATANKIRTALLDKGYYGDESIWAFYDFGSVDSHLREMFAYFSNMYGQSEVLQLSDLMWWHIPLFSQ